MKNLIGNSWRDSSNNKSIEVYNPADDELLDKIPDSTVDDVIEAVKLAVEYQNNWNTLSLHERGNILQKFVRDVKEDLDELAFSLSSETGNALSECLEEVKNIELITELYIRKAKDLYNTNMPNSDDAKDTTIKVSLREPVGVVAVILPSSGSVYTFANKVIAALMMGNSVIIKPSVKVPLTVTRLVYLLRHVGVPEGVIQVIHGDGKSVGQALSMHPNVNIVSFGGSTTNAIKVMGATSKNLTKSLFDLSGNNTLILCRDGDVELAIKETVSGRLYNAGQTNSCNKRYLIHTSLKEEFVKGLLKELNMIRIGRPTDKSTDMGCLISEEAAIIVEKQVQLSLDEGARLVCGGKRSGAYFEPTILDNVTKDMQIASNLEILGPVISIIEFDDINDAIDISNQSLYTQGTSIFTNNMKLAFKASKAVASGRVVINGSTLIKSMTDNYEGRKYSGMGKQGIEKTLEEMSQSKAIVFNDILE